jgi:hypothetical protein
VEEIPPFWNKSQSLCQKKKEQNVTHGTHLLSGYKKR